jgi:hypothetical protein
MYYAVNWIKLIFSELSLVILEKVVHLYKIKTIFNRIKNKY